MGGVKFPHDHGNQGDEDELSVCLRDEGDFEIVASLFKSLSDPTRVKIFWLLCHCEECVINISAFMQMSSPAVSHHLRALRASGLVVCHRRGKEVYYKASDSERCRMLHSMIEDALAVACPRPRTDSD